MNGTEFENDARLNWEPEKIFQEWQRMRKPCDNRSLAVVLSKRFTEEILLTV